jgi:hypothetical protein
MKLRFLDRPPKKILSTQSALSGLTSEQIASDLGIGFSTQNDERLAYVGFREYHQGR